MQLVKKIVLLLMDSKPATSAYSLVFRYLLRGKKIYFVSGMRRSGNHAFIEWLVNSLEKKQTRLKECDRFKHFNTTPSGQTIFLNEVNEINTLIFLRMIFYHKTKIRNSQTLIISTEDCRADYSSYKIPRYDEAIYVKRSLLNLIASRVKYLVKRSEMGKNSYFSAVNTEILDTIRSFQNAGEFKMWEFERWLTSSEYRLSFLEELGLQSSYIPGISRWGGGSSFTGVEELPDEQELTERYLQIKFSDKIISFFQDINYRKLLTPKEREFLELS